MHRKPELEDRLARMRWRTAVLAADAFLREQIGLTPESFSFVDYDRSQDPWERYITRVRAQNDLLLQWPEADVDGLRRWLDAVRSRSRGRRGLWFAGADTGSPPVADVPVEELLTHGIDDFTMNGLDLMLASPDLGDGLCVEVVPLGTQEQFEVEAWGGFAETET